VRLTPLPVAVTAAMMTTAISAAIRPYSIAVAPLSSAMKICMRFICASRNDAAHEHDVGDV
jgi:hypothetical protein